LLYVLISTEGSLFVSGDPSVSHVANPATLEPPTARSAVVSYCIGEVRVKNTVSDTTSRMRARRCSRESQVLIGGQILLVKHDPLNFREAQGYVRVLTDDILEFHV
jgi:hypothetical protein